MNGYDLISKVLNEARGEFDEFEEDYKSWWKSLKNHFKGQKEMIMLNKAKRFPSEEKLIKSMIKNCQVEVRVITSSDINAFTIPGMQGMDDYTRMGMYGWAFWVKYGMPALMKMNLSGVKPGNKPNTAMFPPNKCKFAIFATRGLLTELEPEERVAIYLHEIGHWHYTSKQIPFQMREFYEREGKPSTIYLFMVALGSYLRRYNEYDSDLFSIKAGFGQQLASAFKKLSKTRDKSVANWWIRKADEARKQAIDYHNRAEEQSDARGSYPSMKNRIKQADQYDKNKGFKKRADKHIDR